MASGFRFSHRFILITVFLCAIYTITYSGRIEIADQYQYFTAIRSFSHFGDTALDLYMSQWMPASFDPTQPHPFRASYIEPGFVIAVTPLYQLADRLSGVGIVHTVYLFNVLICGLIGGLIYLYVLQLGYRETTAILAALTTGLLTIVFPYSQTLFREPLMIVFLLLCVMTIERLRPRFHLLTFAFAVITFMIAFVIKEASVLALPGILILITPERWWKRRILWAALFIGITLIIFLIAFTDLMISIQGVLPQGRLFDRFELEAEFTRTALHTYLWSIGGSLWGTSPILLLAIPGGWILWRRGPNDLRLFWAAVIVLLGFLAGYSLLRGGEWFGGTIWPQRFLLPVIPFMILLTLPILDRITQWRSPFLRVLLILLALYSAWWQFSGVSYRWDEYSQLTAEYSFGGLAYWLPSFNEVRYLRPVILMQLWGERAFNFAWLRLDLWPIPLIFSGIALIAAWLLRHPQRRVIRLMPIGLIIAWYGLLRALYPDPLYLGHLDELHAMSAIIQQELDAGEVLMLNDPQYDLFILNHGRFGPIRIPIFPYHPGDRGNADQPLAIESDHPELLLATYTAPSVLSLAQNHARLWLLTSGGPAVPWSIRPLEQFMGDRFYRISEHSTAPHVRLLAYDTAPAPDHNLPIGPDLALAFRFTMTDGETLILDGLHLPRGLVYQAGHTLPITLFWQSPTPLSREYTVAWFLAREGVTYAQAEDSWHGATFAPTSIWRPDHPVLDHRAMQLPPDLLPGRYEIWVRVYWQEVVTGTITPLAVNRDESIAVLPIIVEIHK
jgi:hypothetical protein